MSSSSSSKDYRSINFNQDFSCVSVGTETDFEIFNVDPFGKCFELENGVSASQMLFSTSLVALVGVGNKPISSPRRLQILNTKKESNICELTFPTAVLSIKLNRKRLVAVLIDQIFIYDISCMKLLHTIETSPNPKGLCDLSPNDDSILIYPAPSSNVTYPFDEQSTTSNNSEIGSVILFDALNITPLNIIKAHKAQLSTISLNSTGTLSATASTTGTIIRVFNNLTGFKVAEFRRGSYPASINSLIFNLNSSLLAVSSDTETIHIFKVKEGATNDEEQSDEGEQQQSDEEIQESSILPRLSTSNNNSISIPGQAQRKPPSIANTLLKSLPKNLSSILEPQRDFAFLKITNTLPNHELKKKYALGFNGKREILVGNYNDGNLYIFSIPEDGGGCVLTKQFTFE